MKVKKTYRLEQETIEELEKLCSDSGKSATEVIEGAIHDAIHVPDVERIGDGWAQTVAALTDQLAVKDDQIASLGRALEAAQETAKAAQALHAANVQERALESSEQKESRRWRWIGFCGKIHGCPEHGTPAGIDPSYNVRRVFSIDWSQHENRS